MSNIESIQNHTARISVEDFGPIGKGTVELRPLTVFVGPSNTGKTYFAKLIYMLHQMMGAFPRFPYRSSNELYAGYFRTISLKESGVFMDEVKLLIEKLRAGDENLTLSDIPQIVRDAMQAGFLEDSDGTLVDMLSKRFNRYFEVGSSAELVRESKDLDENANARITLDIKEKYAELWSWSAEIGESIESTLDAENADGIVLLPEGESLSEDTLKNLEYLYGRLAPRSGEYGLDSDQFKEFLGVFERILGELLYYSSEYATPNVYYLPATRSGIIQTHHIITSALVPYHANHGEFAKASSMKVPGDIGDFIQHVIMHGGKEHGSQVLDGLARSIEMNTLRGSVVIDRGLGNYPKLMYHPLDMKNQVDLSRASAMVSELAPLILYLRHILKPGDTFIFEEPEAHLHPAAQIEIAATLARMVNAGVKVIVTTHSDWLLLQIGNSIRQGELEKFAVNEPSAQDTVSKKLQADDVGIWLFGKKDGAEGAVVEEVPFDFINGVEPSDFGNIASEVYNQSIHLMDKYESMKENASKKEE